MYVSPFFFLPFLSSTMVSYRAVLSPCWNWALARSALSLWQQTTMLWGGQELQRGRRVQRFVWAWGRCAAAAPPDIISCLRPKQTVKLGRSIERDWPEAQAYYPRRTPLWSPRVCQPATTPSTSHTCPATLPLHIRTASASLLMWPQLLKLEEGCWGWMETWRSVQMWWRGVVAAWLSRGTSWKPIRLIRSTAHHRLDVRSGSEY